MLSLRKCVYIGSIITYYYNCNILYTSVTDVNNIFNLSTSVVYVQVRHFNDDLVHEGCPVIEDVPKKYFHRSFNHKLIN